MFVMEAIGKMGDQWINFPNRYIEDTEDKTEMGRREGGGFSLSWMVLVWPSRGGHLYAADFRDGAFLAAWRSGGAVAIISDFRLCRGCPCGQASSSRCSVWQAQETGSPLRWLMEGDARRAQWTCPHRLRAQGRVHPLDFRSASDTASSVSQRLISEWSVQSAGGLDVTGPSSIRQRLSAGLGHRYDYLRLPIICAYRDGASCPLDHERMLCSFRDVSTVLRRWRTLMWPDWSGVTGMLVAAAGRTGSAWFLDVWRSCLRLRKLLHCHRYYRDCWWTQVGLGRGAAVELSFGPGRLPGPLCGPVSAAGRGRGPACGPLLAGSRPDMVLIGASGWRTLGTGPVTTGARSREVGVRVCRGGGATSRLRTLEVPSGAPPYLSADCGAAYEKLWPAGGDICVKETEISNDICSECSRDGSCVL